MAYHLPKEPEPCSRCGQANCDEVPSGYWDRLRRALDRAPVITDDDDFDVEPPL